jgi:hypothetical protein
LLLGFYCVDAALWCSVGDWWGELLRPTNLTVLLGLLSLGLQP